LNKVSSNRDRECRIRREQSGHDQIDQNQSQRITRPAGVGEQSVRVAVMPHLIQPGTGEHPHTVRRRVCAIRPTTSLMKV